MSLDAFVSSSRPPPEAIATSQEIRDRSSLFVASIFRVRSVAEARAAQAHMQRAGGQKPPTHAMYAWRYMALKKGKTGLAGEDDFECVSGSEDDGERYGGARILKVMKEEGVLDAVVVVSRWYGGVMLGPLRFDHIDTTAREVCRSFKVRDEMDDLVRSLKQMDALLAARRAELARLTASSSPGSEVSSKSKSVTMAPGTPYPTPSAPTDPTPSSLSTAAVPPASDAPSAPATITITRSKPKETDYAELAAALDVTKARRLVASRESALKSVGGLIRRAALTQALTAPRTSDGPPSALSTQTAVSAEDMPVAVKNPSMENEKTSL